MSVETADVNLQNLLSVDREAADHLFLEADREDALHRAGQQYATMK